MRTKTIYTELAEQIMNLAPCHVLDAGCGDGKLGLALRRLHYTGDYFGIDEDQGAIAMLHRRGFAGECANIRWIDIHPYTKECVVLKDVAVSPMTLGKYMKISMRWMIVSNGWMDIKLSMCLKDIYNVAQQHHFEPCREIAPQLILFQRIKRT